MTEEDKQRHLAFFEELYRQNEARFNTDEAEALKNAMTANLAHHGMNDPNLAQIPLELQEVITTWRSKLEGLQRAINYINQTDAAELTKESIAAVAR